MWQGDPPYRAAVVFTVSSGRTVSFFMIHLLAYSLGGDCFWNQRALNRPGAHRET